MTPPLVTIRCGDKLTAIHCRRLAEQWIAHLSSSSHGRRVPGCEDAAKPTDVSRVTQPRRRNGKVALQASSATTPVTTECEDAAEFTKPLWVTAHNPITSTAPGSSESEDAAQKKPAHEPTAPLFNESEDSTSVKPPESASKQALLGNSLPSRGKHKPRKKLDNRQYSSPNRAESSLRSDAGDGDGQAAAAGGHV